MVDLKGQYEFIKPEVDIALKKVLETTSFINGPAVKEISGRFRNILGCKACDSMCKRKQMRYK